MTRMFRRKKKSKAAKYPDIVRHIDKIDSKFDYSKFGDSINNLIAGGYLVQTEEGYYLTEKGIKFAKQYEKELKIKDELKNDNL